MKIRNKEFKILYNSIYARIGFFIFFTITIICFLGPTFISNQYNEINLALGASAPNSQNLFGTDILGRDLLIRILMGGQISLTIGFLATLIALIIGTTYGLFAGYLGKRIDTYMMRFVDILYALPFTIIVILLTVLFGRSLFLIFLAIGAVEWLTLARITRAETLALKSSSFIDAAKISGLKDSQIIFKHILINLTGPIIVFATLTIPSVLLLESIISFLGLGVQAPLASWGTLINEGAKKFDIYPWLLIFPAIFFSLTILSLNFIGDSVRDAIDPKD